jgi:stage II sporulation protein GA (sporulation sigma-E factor processing peptidase)
VVFLINFFMDYLLLRLTGMLLSCAGTRMRCALAALIGALFFCLLQVWPGEQNGGTALLLQGLCAVVMLRIGCTIKKTGSLLLAALTLYLTAFLFGGFWAACVEKKGHTLRAFFLLTAVFYFAICIFHAGTAAFQSKVRRIYRVTLRHGGSLHRIRGFYDTGNLLWDPVCAKPVSVLCAKTAEAVLGRKTMEKLKYIIENPGELENTELSQLKPHFLSVKTVDRNRNLMLAITLDELCIHTPGEVVHISSPVFALLFEPSALGNEYEVLLNSRYMH